MELYCGQVHILKSLVLMTKVCVTGGSGFIGSYVVEECLKRGYHVVATVRDVNKCKHLENMPGGTLTLVHADLTIVEFSISCALFII